MALTTEGSKSGDSPPSAAGRFLVARGVVLLEDDPWKLVETGVTSLLWPKYDNESLRGVLEPEEPIDGVFNELSEDECEMTLPCGGKRPFSAPLFARPSGLPS